jgi:peptidoglycan/LPS O-acetylase OafA/YrhL
MQPQRGSILPPGGNQPEALRLRETTTDVNGVACVNLDLDVGKLQVPQRMPELDGLRGLACLMVVVFHYVQFPSNAGTSAFVLNRCLTLAWTGVDLFFVLSGFLLGGICMDNRHASNFFRVFYTRRTCRIFPLYFAWLGLSAAFLIAQAPLWDRQMINQIPLWAYPVYLQNLFMASANHFGPPVLAPTWSLAIEEQFYLILPALIYFTPQRWLPALAGCLIVSGVVCRWILLVCFAHYSFAPFLLLPCRWDALFLGVLGAWLVRHHAISIAEGRSVLWVALAVLSGGMILFSMRGSWAFSPWLVRLGYTWFAMFYLCLILLALHSPLLSWIARRKSLMWLGGLSYGIYLFHEGASELFCHLFGQSDQKITSWPSATVALLAFIATLATAWASYRYFEAPIIKLGHSWKYLASRSSSAASAS